MLKNLTIVDCLVKIKWPPGELHYIVGGKNCDKKFISHEYTATFRDHAEEICALRTLLLEEGSFGLEEYDIECTTWIT